MLYSVSEIISDTQETQQSRKEEPSPHQRWKIYIFYVYKTPRKVSFCAAVHLLLKDGRDVNSIKTIIIARNDVTLLRKIKIWFPHDSTVQVSGSHRGSSHLCKRMMLQLIPNSGNKHIIGWLLKRPLKPRNPVLYTICCCQRHK